MAPSFTDTLDEKAITTNVNLLKMDFNSLALLVHS